MDINKNIISFNNTRKQNIDEYVFVPLKNYLLKVTVSKGDRFASAEAQIMTTDLKLENPLHFVPIVSNSSITKNFNEEYSAVIETEKEEEVWAIFEHKN